jgi:hypothetical protein
LLPTGAAVVRLDYTCGCGRCTPVSLILTVREAVELAQHLRETALEVLAEAEGGGRA